MIREITFNIEYESSSIKLKLRAYDKLSDLVSATKLQIYNLPKSFDFVEHGRPIENNNENLAALFDGRKFVSLKITTKVNRKEVTKSPIALPGNPADLKDHGNCICDHKPHAYFCRKCKSFICSACRAKVDL